MKKYLIYTAAAIVAVSCAKNPAPVETTNEEPGAPAVEGNVAVQFSSNLVTNPQTKASGFVDEWNKQTLFIYGFPKKGNPLKPDYTEPFIDNKSATAPEKTNQETKVINGKIKVWRVDPEEPATEGEYYYYEGTKTYDFFGYYADGALTEEPTKDVSGVTAPVKITGGEDIMVAAASVDDAVTAAKGKDETAIAAWEAKNKNWNPKYAFSAYAARRGVHPILKFKHLLTQLKFTVTSGGNLAANTLYIKSITLADVSNTATLTVAGETLGFSQWGTANQQLSVVHAYGENYATLASQNEGKGVVVPASTPTPTPVGAPIMPFEASSFKILIQLSQKGVTVDPAPIEQIIDMTKVLVPDTNRKKPGESGYAETYGGSNDKFEAGKAYTINFKLYGLEKVEVTAELTAWKEGGQIEIDTDTPPEVNPTTPEPEPGTDPEN